MWVLAAVVMLVAFVLVTIGLVVALLGVGLWLVFTDHPLGGGLVLLGVSLIYLFFLSLRRWRPDRREPTGLTVTRADQPQLWQEIDRLAAVTRSPGPDELRLVPETTVSVWQRTRLLRRRRYLAIGSPLLASMTVGELRAVLAGELSRPGAGRRRLATVAHIQQKILAAVPAPVRLLGLPIPSWFATAVRRRQREADIVSVHAAGRSTAQSALRTQATAGLGWSVFVDRYLRLAVLAGRTPEVHAGFRSFLANTDRYALLTAKADYLVDAGVAAETENRPTVRARMSAMDSVPEVDVDTDDRPAWDLLADPASTVAALDRQMLRDDLGPSASWPEIAELAGPADARAGAAQLAKAGVRSGLAPGGTIGEALDVLARGRLVELARPALNPGLADDDVPAAAREVITAYLADAILAVLADQGKVVHRLDWAGPMRVSTTDGEPFDARAIVAPAVADPAELPTLRRRLAELAVPETFRVPPAGELPALLRAVVTNVAVNNNPYHLLLCNTGLLLVDVKAKVEGQSVAYARSLPGSVWLDNEVIFRGRIRARELSLTMNDGTRWDIAMTARSDLKGQPLVQLETLLGARILA